MGIKREREYFVHSLQQLKRFAPFFAPNTTSANSDSVSTKQMARYGL